MRKSNTVTKRIRYGLFSLLFICSFFASLTIFGQAVTRLESPEVLMGKLLKMDIDVQLPTDTTHVSFPLLEKAEKERKKFIPLLNDTIELLVSHRKTTEERNGKKWMNYSLEIQSFDSGRYEVPSFEFIVDGKSVKSNPISLNVLPVKVKADDKLDDFSDIVMPFEINPNPNELDKEKGNLIWWLILIAILLIGLISYLYLRYKRTGRFLQFSKPEPVFKQALNRLKKLKEQQLPEKNKTKDYYTRLCDILRFYLNRQFGIKTFEKTSAEIIKEISQNDNLAIYAELVKSIFNTSDFVKFAKVNPSQIENERCMNEAVTFIENSHPAFDNVSDKEGGKK